MIHTQLEVGNSETLECGQSAGYEGEVGYGQQGRTPNTEYSLLS